MKNHPTATFARTIIGMAIIAAWMPNAWADDLNFSYAPASNTHKPPAPNVIISVDDSGSMATKDSGSSKTRMQVLKDALNETFTADNVPNDAIRIGWMSMNAKTTSGRTTTYPGTEPTIKILDSTVRTEFFNWITGLTPEGGTPAHRMLYRAGEYLKNNTAAWASYPSGSVPAGKNQQYLGCRRSYNVFLTDGSWNFPDMADGTNLTTYGPSWLRQVASLANLTDIGNADGKENQIFPDGTAYDPSSDQTKIYSDKYGAVSATVSYNGAVTALTDWSATRISKPSSASNYENQSDSYGPLYSCQEENNGRSGTRRQYRWTCIARGAPTAFSSYPTLSDLAFYYWATDLQPQIAAANGGEYTLDPQIRHSGVENIGGSGKTLALQEYWNPKNNPATWPHMTMFTVGFGPGAQIDKPDFGSDTWTGGDYQNLLLGNSTTADDKKWGDPELSVSTSGGHDGVGRRAELWHAAINSRGTFVPVTQADQLVTAFKTILNQIISDNTKPMTSVTLTANTLRLDSNMYVSSYDPANWTGTVTAYAVDAGTGAVNNASVWSSAAKMDASTNFHSSRKVFSHNGSQGIEFKWNSLSQAQKNTLKGGSNASDTVGQDRLNYLRGQNVSSLRQRNSIHGDIVNSRIWYYNGDAAYLKKQNKTTVAAEQRKMLYVGANDGMLHGFNPNTGAEVLAYVPRGLYDKLPALTTTDYVHQYYVDGSPFVAEVDTTPSAAAKDKVWKDYLVGTLGAGGKGYFILDVTDPASFAPGNVKLDVTDTADADIGYIFSEPVAEQASATRATQLTRLNDGRWAFVTGNGYNSTNQNSVLLIQYLDGTLMKLTATPASKTAGNGLSAPRLIDLTGDGVPDVAYAGDLSGNLWKFNLSCAADKMGGESCAGDFGVSLGGQPLFTTKDNQPITTAPAFIQHSSAPGLMLTFGTGQNLTNEDRTTTYQQTLYGIHDRAKWKAVSGGALQWQEWQESDAEYQYQTSTYPIALSELQAMTLTANQAATAWTVTGDVDYVNRTTVNDDGESVEIPGTFKKGWYLDLPVTKSRVLRDIEWIQGNWFRVRFTVPAEGGAGGTTDLEETCEPVYSSKEDYVGIFSAISGRSLNLNDEGGFREDPSQGLSIYVSDGEGGQKPVTPPDIPKDEDFPSTGSTGLTPTWRQIQ
ncbi:hypothetical protein D8I35_14125 [Corticibacter populi]|uniref:PilY1 beta-propeller domain-containing protein n=1 Tax=Corticibacter populi TaxID=1550736 RepID=A0A3M6QPJ0_9BURK|nr:PilC/PilY family type IV pilus protein [Corticibacter populi]RMX04984.1 hypothetical protein D8I35_14125 [Corticibacter populi]RZS33585.1 type IV pilus assembly protein PilY1 [Corticibacter populi]